MVQGCVTNAIKGTEFEGILKNGVTRQWVRRFSKRNGLHVRSGRPTEERRAAWGTSANLLKHYMLVAAKFQKMGAAISNPEYQPDVPYSEPILIITPEM